jgi:hypothetical protein
MDNYVSNCPISRPIRIVGIQPEVDLNGVMFSYRCGLMYTPAVTEPQLRLPEGL